MENNNHGQPYQQGQYGDHQQGSQNVYYQQGSQEGYYQQEHSNGQHQQVSQDSDYQHVPQDGNNDGRNSGYWAPQETSRDSTYGLGNSITPEAASNFSSEGQAQDQVQYAQVPIANSNGRYTYVRVHPPMLNTSPEALTGHNKGDIYDEEDDAQSFMQPTISPMATRLSLPRTPAAEKAKAMDEMINSNVGGGFFDTNLPPVPDIPVSNLTSRMHRATISTPPSTQPSAPAPSTAKAKNTTNARPVASGTAPGGPQPSKPSAMSVFQAGARHSRSSSVGSDALKRLSKALPSMPSISSLSSLSFPKSGSFLPNLSTTSFFSHHNNNSSTTVNNNGSISSAPSSRKISLQASPTTATSGQNSSTTQRTSPLAQAYQAPDPNPYSRRHNQNVIAAGMSSGTASPAGDLSGMNVGIGRPPMNRPPSTTSRRSYGLRRSTSDDSLLYHTLSRAPSHGDEEQFEHIREQVNSRVKAIMDSFDRPTFKMPQLPKGLFPDAKNGTTSAPREPASPLDAALENLTGDIVVLGGYRGSILRSAEPPHRQLWVPVKVGLNIRKVNMEVGLDPEDEEDMPNHIFPSGMLKHIGPVDISRRLFKKLRECENARKGLLRVHDYGYDWRLSPHRLSKQLAAFLETLPCNQPGYTGAEGKGAVVIAHSLGGLITRHVINQRPELFSGVVFAGVPQRCVNVLGPLRNGDAVLLNEKVLTAQVNFSLRTTFVFLPEDGFCFVNSNDPTEEYRVNFYDINEWMRYRWSPCVAPAALPAFQSLVGGNNADNSQDSGANNSSSNANKRSSTHFGRALTAAAAATASLAKDRLIAPQMDKDGGSGEVEDSSNGQGTPNVATYAPDPSSPAVSNTFQDIHQSMATSPPPTPPADPQQAKSVEYLKRTLAEIKQFRSELAHNPQHTADNVYPPMAVIYGKGTPTVYAARVGSRVAIACADAYDDLVFRTGDGVVLAKEATLPPGYSYVRDGYVSTDRGHVGMLGDLNAVGKVLGAIVRGRQKGIGRGLNYTNPASHQRVGGRASTMPSMPSAPVIPHDDSHGHNHGQVHQQEHQQVPYQQQFQMTHAQTPMQTATAAPTTN